MARFLVDTFGREVSPTLLLDLFIGISVIIIAALFLHSLRKIIKARDEEDE